MSLRLIVIARTVLALAGLFVFASCDGDGGSRALCEDVCAQITDECAADAIVPREDCVEVCNVDRRSRIYREGEDTCLECCANVALPPDTCTDADLTEVGFSLCLDNPDVCGCECRDNILTNLDVTISPPCES